MDTSRNALVRLLAAHGFALLTALQRMRRAPLGAVLTVAILAVAIALPMATYVSLQAIEDALGGVAQQARASVFLSLDQDQVGAARIQSQLADQAGIADAQTVSPEQGMREMQQIPGFQGVMDAVEDNPLPWVIELELSADAQLGDDWRDDVLAIPGVEDLRMDREWLARLKAVTGLVRQSADVISVFIALASILLIGNSMRLEIQTRADEIEILKLVGASDAFAQRPFVYSGALLGLGGALAAAVLLLVCWLLVRGALEGLLSSYGLNLAAIQFQWITAYWFMICGIVLGGLGAWLSAKREIALIEPDF